MGVGKTTIGKLLAQTLSFNFVDLDETFVAINKLSIADFITTRGEQAFRYRELDAYQKTLAQLSQPTIMATGGGFPCFFDNIKQMKKDGPTIYLKSKPNTLYKRISINPSAYPILKNEKETNMQQTIQQLLSKRENFYQSADFTVDIDRLSPSQCVKKILALPLFCT